MKNLDEINMSIFTCMWLYISHFIVYSSKGSASMCNYLYVDLAEFDSCISNTGTIIIIKFEIHRGKWLSTFGLKYRYTQSTIKFSLKRLSDVETMLGILIEGIGFNRRMKRLHLYTKLFRMISAI